jgi:hypothetical protein
MRTTRKKTIVIGIVAASLMGGSALAYWTTSGGSDSTGTATAGSASGITVEQTSFPSNLRPGSPAQDIAFKLTNPSASQSTYVTEVVASLGAVDQTTAGALLGTCDSTDFTLVSATKTINHDFAHGETASYPSGLSIEFNNKLTNQDACQGATVHLTLTAS